MHTLPPAASCSSWRLISSRIAHLRGRDGSVLLLLPESSLFLTSHNIKKNLSTAAQKHNIIIIKHALLSSTIKPTFSQHSQEQDRSHGSEGCGAPDQHQH